MTLNVRITKDGSKNTHRMLSEFSRAVFSSGIVRHLKTRKRYFSRNVSHLIKKKAKLKRLAKQAQLEQDIKDGKVAVNARGQIVKK